MTCNKPLKFEDEAITLVGTIGKRDPLHRHDFANCKTRVFICKDGHSIKIPILITCPNCDWIGKETCFCHEGVKTHPDSKEANPEICNKEI